LPFCISFRFRAWLRVEKLRQNRAAVEAELEIEATLPAGSLPEKRPKVWHPSWSNNPGMAMAIHL